MSHHSFIVDQVGDCFKDCYPSQFESLLDEELGHRDRVDFTHGVRSKAVVSCHLDEQLSLLTEVVIEVLLDSTKIGSKDVLAMALGDV